MNYQRIILAGNVTADAQRKRSKKGDVTFVTFSLAVGEDRDKVTYFPVTVFGTFGENIAQYVTKGRQLLVEGRIEVSESDRFNVVADQIRLGTLPKGSKSVQSDEAGAA
jgi:single-stranded DNA-binding protein